jgi:hypothetical protein
LSETAFAVLVQQRGPTREQERQDTTIDDKALHPAKENMFGVPASADFKLRNTDRPDKQRSTEDRIRTQRHIPKPRCIVGDSLPLPDGAHMSQEDPSDDNCKQSRSFDALRRVSWR